MINILKELAPIQSQKTEFLFNLAIISLKDKKHIVRLPDVSPFEIEVYKTNKGLSIINHQNYTSTVTNLSFPTIRKIIKCHFKTYSFQDLGFVLDLRF